VCDFASRVLLPALIDVVKAVWFVVIFLGACSMAWGQWQKDHPAAHAVRDVPGPRRCYVAPLRGGGGMVTYCNPEEVAR
jgi:hypothetical protein